MRVFASLVSAVVVAVAVGSGCDSSSDSGPEDADAGGAGGTSPAGSGGTSVAGTGATSTGGTGGTSTGGTGGTSTGGTGGTSTGGTGGTSTGGTGGTSADGTGGTSVGGTGGTSTGGTGGSADPFEAARVVCINHINELRATKGRAAYARWTAIEPCVDTEATYDSTNGPHAAFMSGKSCGESSQGECPGQGPDSAVGCIDLMWSEKDQSICSGCDACPSLMDGWNGNCPNCKVQTSSPTCGHYLALVTSAQSQAACGWSTAGAYMAIDYQ